jgi:divalent metal cation (Fe/Co/Zn/Cd) transporter
MGFLDFLGTFVKRILFFVGGFVVAFPLAGTIMTIGGTSRNFQFNPNPIMAIIAIIIFIVGIAMMYYAVKLEG